MPALMVGVCTACQKNKHDACANEGACVCALRDHPNIPERPNLSANPVYIPNPGEG
jgi:hypothetical protein